MTINLAADGYPFTLLKSDMCRLLNCHENTLYKRIQAGQVPAYVRGSGPRARYEWRRPDVEAWLSNRRALLRRPA
jgi:hypothetical protein